MTNKKNRDNLFNSTEDLAEWVFDENVSKVFDDMVLRSVPGYRHMIENIFLLSKTYAQHDTKAYDLGCSTGAVSHALASTNKNIHIIAIDNSPSMLKKCRENLKNVSSIAFQCTNIEDVNITNASIVVLNLTLQFIPPQERNKVLRNIYDGLVKNGIIIISEKLKLTQDDQILEMLHLNFKRYNGYSESEIANKRQMLENKLISDSKKMHLKRLKDTGFTAYQLSQYLNFGVFLGIKSE